MKMPAWMMSLVIFSICSGAHAAERNAPAAPVLRISALASGKILLEGKETSLPAVKQALEKATKENGTVWYYRENPSSEPPPQAMEVVKLIIANKLPVSFSSKPDFSDYIDEKGRSQPRK
jgi:hypothetical protein